MQNKSLYWHIQLNRNSANAVLDLKKGKKDNMVCSASVNNDPHSGNSRYL